MEPNDLKSDRPDDAQLEAWLRANATLSPLPDHGFTPRVLTALPPPRSCFHRLWFCLAGAGVGAGVALWPLLQSGALSALDTALLHALEQLTQPGVGIALVLTLVSLGYVFWSDLRRIVQP